MYNEITSLCDYKYNILPFLILCWQLLAMCVSVPSSSSLSQAQLRVSGGCGVLLDDCFKGVFPALNWSLC